MPKMALQSRYGQYEFLMMSFCLTNVQAAYIELINRVFRNYLDSFVIIFIDDIFVYSKSDDDHMSHLRVVLHVLKKNQLFDKYSK